MLKTIQKRKECVEDKLNIAYRLCRKAACVYHLYTRALGREDLAQYAMIRVWRAMDKYDSTKPWEAFVWVIAINTCKTACGGRHNEIIYYLDELNWEKSENDSIRKLAAMEKDKLRSEVCQKTTSGEVYDMTAFLSRLPRRQRQVIEKSFGVGACQWEESDEKIARDLNITRQTVVSDRKKALVMLKSCVDDLYLDELSA